jgi:mannan endo-1,4-beta-mannosidase
MQMAAKLDMPIVLEEFGISRDNNSHDPKSSANIRDKYYAAIFDDVYRRMMDSKGPVAGCNFWAWGGEGRPAIAGGLWKPGDDFIGDPPHEPQGWYSVYDTDSSTIKIIQEYAGRINTLSKNRQK